MYVALGLLLEKDGGDGGDCGIACAQVGRTFGEPVDGEWREPHGGVFTDRIKNVGRSGGASSGFRNKERVAVTVIAVCPVGEVRGVEVRRVNVDRRTGSLPDINHTRLGASTWIIARGGVFTGKPGVHVHRKVVGGFALAGYGLNVSRIVPGHEDLVRARGVAKYLRPATGGLLTLLLPERAKFGIERVAMSSKVFGQLRGHGGGEGLFGRGRMVASIAEDADFVFNLHHDDRVVAAVHLAKVLHDRGERPGVGVAGGIGEAGNGAENTGFVVVQA